MIHLSSFRMFSVLSKVPRKLYNLPEIHSRQFCSVQKGTSGVNESKSSGPAKETPSSPNSKKTDKKNPAKKSSGSNACPCKDSKASGKSSASGKGCGQAGNSGDGGKGKQPQTSYDDVCGRLGYDFKTHSKHYRYLSYGLTTFVVILAGYVLSHFEEHEHKFVPYEYMYINHKRFPWGDGNKSFFHGPNNFIYEEEIENYEKKPYSFVDEDLERRKKLRDQHAKEELERRKKRQEEEELLDILAKEKENGDANANPDASGDTNAADGNASGDANANGNTDANTTDKAEQNGKTQ